METKEVKTTETTIQLTPGVDWEKEDVVLVTVSGTRRSTKGKKYKYADFIKNKKEFYEGLSENFIEMVDDRGPGEAKFGHDVIVVGDEYVAVKSYKKVDYGWKVADLDKALKSGSQIIEDECNHIKAGWRKETDKIKYPKMNSEVRIYKDRSFVKIYRFKWDSGEERFYVLNKDFLKVNKTNFVEKTFAIKPLREEDREMLREEEGESSEEKTVYMITPEDVEGTISQVYVGEIEYDEEGNIISGYKRFKVFTRIYTDKDAKENAIRGTKKNSCLDGFLTMMGGSGLLSSKDKRGKMKNYCYGAETTRFEKDLRDAVNKFFEVFDEKSKDLKESFDTKCQKIGYWGSSRKIEDGIVSLSYLNKYLELKEGQAASEKKKKVENEEIWNQLHWPEKRNAAMWERTEDDRVILTKQFCDEDERAAFIYDVKKKTRKVLLCTKNGYTGEKKIVSQIPSLYSGILGNFHGLSEMEDYRYEDGRYQTIKVPRDEITNYGGKTAEEIFRGTNVGWILENKDLIGEDTLITVPTGSDYRAKKCTTLRREFKDGVGGKLALAILATTGNIIMEQLLKNKFFNMYFAALREEGESTEGPKEFREKEKAEKRRTYGIRLVYDKKEKSLKKMLGMTSEQIKMVDEVTRFDIEEDKEGWDNKRFRVPALEGVTKFLGIKAFNEIGIDQFKKVIEISKIEEEKGYGEGKSRWQALLRDERKLKETFENLSVNEKLNYILKLEVGDVEKYVDYIEMRNQLKKVQERLPEEDIFDEKAFPVRVKDSTKFIRFVEGMKKPKKYGWESEETIETEHEFKQYIKERYCKEEGESVEYEVEGGKITGAVVRMDAGGNMRFLHDEMTRWFNLYEDEAENAEFQKALVRVKDLEWEDKDGELCIQAPKCAGEIRNEGAVLEHCVASFVEPIILGKENIMFVRRKDMKNEPFYTVDINNYGEIRQIHCWRNGNVGQEEIDRAYAKTKREVYNIKTDVFGFMKRWAKAMKGKIKERTIEKTYGRLCAEH